MLGYPVATIEDIYQDEQLQARDFWQDVTISKNGATLKHPGGFAIFNGERLQIHRPAPQIGEHNCEVYGKDLGLSQQEIARLKGKAVI